MGGESGSWMDLRSSGGSPAAAVARAGLGASPPDSPSPSPGESLPGPRLEDEIDFLAQELAQQEPRHSMLTAQPQPEGGQRQLEPGETQPIPPPGGGRGSPAPRLPTAFDPRLVLVF